MARDRDNQRQRVYDAEDLAAFRHTGTRWAQTIPNDRLDAFYEKVFSRATFRRRWPNQRLPKVRLTHGGGRALYSWNEIRLGRDARNEWVMLHELAHLLTPRDAAAHGPEFAGVMLWLVSDNLGKQAAEHLRAAYKEKRVRKSNAAIPEVKALPKRDREEERLVKAVEESYAAWKAATAALAAHRVAKKALAA